MHNIIYGKKPNHSEEQSSTIYLLQAFGRRWLGSPGSSKLCPHQETTELSSKACGVPRAEEQGCLLCMTGQCYRQASFCRPAHTQADTAARGSCLRHAKEVHGRSGATAGPACLCAQFVVGPSHGHRTADLAVCCMPVQCWPACSAKESSKNGSKTDSTKKTLADIVAKYSCPRHHDKCRAPESLLQGLL